MTETQTTLHCRAIAQDVIQIETKALQALAERIDENFDQACQHLIACQGRIVVLGMGKSGHIGSKIAATLASTGSPAFFVHPGEANHGDLGMITAQDVVLAISYSGETQEILTLLPLIQRQGIPLITLTGNPTSTLAKKATVNLDVRVEREACPLDLAPTASTTATLVMGDALAVALLKARGFTAEDFARSHPGGKLGRRLLLLVDDLMHTGSALPKVTPETCLKDALFEITEKKLGLTTVVDPHNKLLGVFTDGDLRRALNNGLDLHQTRITEVMTTHPQTILPGVLAVDALQMMENLKITALAIVNLEQEIQGIIHLHDLLQAKVG